MNVVKPTYEVFDVARNGSSSTFIYSWIMILFVFISLAGYSGEW